MRDVHDAARQTELRYAGIPDAFIPFETAAEREGLFEYKHIDVASASGHVAGFCAYSEEEIAWLYVDPLFMRRGIGRKLLRHALETESGVYYAEALVGNIPAVKLYESEGFNVREILSGRMPGNEQYAVSVYCMYRKS